MRNSKNYFDEKPVNAIELREALRYAQQQGRHTGIHFSGHESEELLAGIIHDHEKIKTALMQTYAALVNHGFKSMNVEQVEFIKQIVPDAISLLID